MKKVYIFALFLFFPSVCRTETALEAIMVADVIRAMERPSSVIATLCWSTYEKLSLYSALAEPNVTQAMMIQFLKPDDVPRRHAQDQHVVFLVDLNCDEINMYFKKSNAQKHFLSPFRWILIDKTGNDTQEIPSVIDDIDVLPDSEVMVARRVTNNSFELNYIYKISTGLSWRTELYGTWDNQNRTQKLISEESTALRRADLEGYEISICYVLTDNETINHLTDGINDHLNTLTKVNFRTTNHLIDFLKASRKYVFVESWGYKLNGTWNGMTGYLVRNEVEIGGSPLFFTAERFPVLEYVSSPTRTRSKFVFQQPKLSYENNLFLLSFRSSVWYSAIGLVSLLFLALFAVTRWEWKRQRYTSSNNPGVLNGNLADVALLIFGAACQQGSPVELKGSLGRVVMLVLFLALMFLYSSYSANIVALLQSSSSQIKTLEDLLHSRLKFAVHDTIYNRYYFAATTEPIRKAIYNTKIAPPGAKPRFMTMEEGVKNIQKGLFAFHMETGVGYKFVGKYFQEGEKCGLKEIEYLQLIDPWLAVRKSTPYKEMFKIGFKRMQEHGLQNRENLLLYEKKPKCSGRESNFISVSMVDCYPALLVLTYGMIVAIFLLAIEVLLKKKERIQKTICCNKEINE